MYFRRISMSFLALSVCIVSVVSEVSNAHIRLSLSHSNEEPRCLTGVIHSERQHVLDFLTFIYLFELYYYSRPTKLHMLIHWVLHLHLHLVPALRPLSALGLPALGLLDPKVPEHLSFSPIILQLFYNPMSILAILVMVFISQGQMSGT